MAMADLEHSGELQGAFEVPGFASGSLAEAERQRLEVLKAYSILDTPPEAEFDRIVRLAASHFGVPVALLSFVDDQRQWVKAQVGTECTEVPLSESMCAVALRSEVGLVVPDTHVDTRFSQYRAVTAAPHVRFYAGVPLTAPEGERIGTLCLVDHVPRVLSDDDRRLLQDYAHLAMDALSYRRSLLQLQGLVLKDALTGLPNRLHLREFLSRSFEQAAKSGEKVAVVMLDLDDFKSVNDQYSHAVGDELLVDMATRLREAVRSSDLVARLGGDEFMLVVPGLRDLADLEVLFQRLSRVFGAPFVSQALAQPFYMRWSAGVALYPDDAEQSDVLMRCADEAMYRAKKAGGGYAYASAVDDQTLNERQKLSALHQALGREEFLLCYQPLVSSSDWQVVGHEVLMRWARPEGLVLPGSFMGLAERSGLVVPIGHWVLTQAISALQRGDVKRAFVNVSAHEFLQDDFVPFIEGLLSDSGVDPSALTLEITETVLLDPVYSRSSLMKLRALGVCLALDDFGTGYSSMSAVLKLPISMLKIDRSFVSDLGAPGEVGERALQVIRAIISLARAYGVDTVGEGVETELQAKILAAEGCTYLQGYFFGYPTQFVSATS